MNSPDLPLGANEANVADWFESHGAYVRSLARALVHDAGSAADLEQETWRAALERRGSLRDPRAWLAATAKNLAWTAGRSERRRAARERRAARPESDADLQRGAASLQAADMLQRALHQLDEPFKSAVVARYLEGLGPQQIAERDGTPIGTVKSRLKRGLAQLRALLDAENDGERQAWCQALVVGLVGRSGATPKIALASKAAGGLWTAAIAMKLTALFVVPILVGLLLWTQSAGGEAPAGLTPEVNGVTETALADGPLVDLPDEGRAAAADVPEAEALPGSAVAAEAGHVLTLRVEVFDERGRPAPRATVSVAPPDHPFNFVGQTDATGELTVHWRSRRPSMQVDVIVHSGYVDLVGVRRVEARANEVRRIVVAAPLERGSKYQLRFDDSKRSGRLRSFFSGAVELDDGEIAFRHRRREPMVTSFEAPDSDPAISEAPGTISGTVLDAHGSPVAGYALGWARVTSEDDQERVGQEHRLVSAADGAFEFEVPPGTVRCAAGPAGREVTLEAAIASGETRAWNPVVSRSNDVLFHLTHPGGGDVDGIIVEASYDDGKTLWVKRSTTSDEGHAAILDWPESIVELALVAPEKVAPVPLAMIPGVRTGEPFQYELPADSELTVLRVTATSPTGADPPVSPSAVQIFDARGDRGVYLPAALGQPSWTATLPGGTWDIQTDWAHGASTPPLRIVVDGDQPIDLGELQPPPSAALVLPDLPADFPADKERWTIHLCMDAIDTEVHDSGDDFGSVPEDRTLTLPPGRYRVSVTDAKGVVQDDEFDLAAGTRHELKRP